MEFSLLQFFLTGLIFDLMRLQMKVKMSTIKEWLLFITAKLTIRQNISTLCPVWQENYFLLIIISFLLRWLKKAWKISDSELTLLLILWVVFQQTRICSAWGLSSPEPFRTLHHMVNQSESRTLHRYIRLLLHTPIISTFISYKLGYPCLAGVSPPVAPRPPFKRLNVLSFLATLKSCLIWQRYTESLSTCLSLFPDKKFPVEVVPSLVTTQLLYRRLLLHSISPFYLVLLSPFCPSLPQGRPKYRPHSTTPAFEICLK